MSEILSCHSNVTVISHHENGILLFLSDTEKYLTQKMKGVLVCIMQEHLIIVFEFREV